MKFGTTRYARGLSGGRSTRRILKAALCLFLASLPSAGPAAAQNGIAVSAHWTGGHDNLIGGYGKIMRYDIREGKSVKATVLFDGEARYATLDTRGRRVAFIKKSGWIAVMPIDGGQATDLVQVTSTRGYLDWPTGDWIHYSKGGYAEAGSKEMWKVNASTKATQKVVDFRATQWQWSLSHDAKRASLRPSDGQDGGGTGHVYRYAFDQPSETKKGNADDLGMGCGNAISPDGQYIMRFDNYDHNRIVFHRWDKSVVKTVTIATMNGWGKNLGNGFNRNLWSANSEGWICAMQGWGGRSASRGGNQVLYNWMDGKQIAASDNADGSKGQNEPGDFWLEGNPSSNFFPGREAGITLRPASATWTGMGVLGFGAASRDARGRLIFPVQAR